MAVYFIIVGLIIGAGYWTVKPLLGNGDYRDFDESFPGDGAREKYIAKKENAYAAIQELEFEVNMGKLSEEDFQVMKQQYMQAAITCLKEIDDLESALQTGTFPVEGGIEVEIEREVAAIRSRRPSSPRRHMFCSACGEKISLANRFCSSCGTRLPDRGEVVGEEAMEQC